jgi:hypothetical protein
MSLKNELREFWAWVLGLFGGSSGGSGGGNGLGPVAWQKATKASCWSGSNANRRHMNALSPTMPDAKFTEYLEWQVARGCNTVHWFLVNYGDGEYARVNPYGPDWGAEPVPAWVDLMKARIRIARKRGLAVVLWLMADDSGTWARRPEAAFIELYRVCKSRGLFDAASYLVLGLELNEYWDAGRVARLAGQLRSISGLKVGIHQTSDRMEYAPHGDIFLYQTNPGKSAGEVEGLVHGVCRRVNKPVVAFELDRHENRGLCEAAFRGGAFAVGNW